MENFELAQSPRPTHKTSGITKTEWREAIMTPSEVLRNDKAESFIDGDLSFLQSEISWDDLIDIESHPTLLAFAGFTYRDALRSTFKSFKDAPSLAVNNRSLQAGVYLQSIGGLLDSPARVQVILDGVPL
jgi:hypothetical protein